MKKNILLILIIIILSVGLRFAISSFSGIKRQKIKSIYTPPNVVVQTIKDENIIQNFEAPGRVVSKYQVSVLARISGYLEKAYFKEGDNVKAGDTLFLIEPTEYQNASKVAAANIQNIKAKLEYANKQLKRAEELVKEDYIAKSKYDEILANRDSVQAELKAMQSQYADANRNLSYTVIKSPVKGRIGIIDVTVGNYVSPSTGALTTINSTTPIYVKFPLSSEDYARISKIDKNSNKPRKVEIYFPDGEKYKYIGTQDFLDNKVDITTGTVTMRATFENPDNRLLHGEFVNVKLYANSLNKVPVVPIVAVQENQEGKFVYKLDENDLPELTYIKVQGQNNENWIIKDGLKQGDRVIVDGILKVIPGNPVNILTQEEMNSKKQNINNNKKIKK